MKKTPVTFTIAAVKTLQFAIIEKSYTENSEVGLSVSFGFGCNKEKHELLVLIKIEYLQAESPFLLLEAGCEFFLDEAGWNAVNNEKGKSIRIPQFLARHTAVITTGTARGILHAKTENTLFNKFILPTVNVEAMIGEDIVLEE